MIRRLLDQFLKDDISIGNDLEAHVYPSAPNLSMKAL